MNRKDLANLILIIAAMSCIVIPDGYALEVNKYGKYRPIREKAGTPLFWLQESGTRCEAIRRAIQQHEYETKGKDEQWRRTE